MVAQKLFCQVARFKTLRYLALIFMTLVLFVNVFILFSAKIFTNDESYSLFVNPRMVTRESRRIARNSLTILPQQSTSSHVPSSSTGSRTIHSYPVTYYDCQAWCCHHLSPPYQLSAVLLVRVYRRDLAGLSSRELLQWLFYLRFAGFDHVFVYDAYVSKNESQYQVLSPLVRSGYVTYTDWSLRNPYTIEGTQISAYQDCVDKYGKNLTWHMAIDIDEYPFSPIDVKPGFMKRFIHNFSVENPHVSQMTLQNFLFLGKPLSPQANPLLIARLRRRTHQKANDLGKSVFQVARIQSAAVHHNEMRDGMTIDSDPRIIRLNHYWGARLQNWGEDTQKILDLTEPDFSIKPIVDQLKSCLIYFEAGSLYMKRLH